MRITKLRFRSIGLLRPLLLLLLLGLSTSRAQSPEVPGAAPLPPPQPPAQPADGPGGTRTAHASVTAHRYGENDAQYWIFEPAEPAPPLAPVIVFLHGWGGMDPNGYGAWIEHLVRRGNIVIFPRYQATLSTHFDVFTPNTIAAFQAALRELATGAGHIRPDLTRVAYIGHSMGGALAANLAALAGPSELPLPRAILCVEPGDGARHSPVHMPRADLAAVPAGTLLLCIVGDQDRIVGTSTAERIFAETTSILPADKNFITLHSDAHGVPALAANHFAPVAIGTIFPARQPGTVDAAAHLFPVNALDFYGCWKFADALTGAAFFGQHREYALGDTAEQRFMGKWSDGVAVREATVRLAP